MPPKARTVPAKVEYQTVDADAQRAILTQRLTEAEHNHYNTSVSLSLFKAQDGDNKAQVVAEQTKIVAQHAQAVLKLQALLAQLPPDEEE